MARRKTTLSVVYSQANPSIQQSQKPKANRRRREGPPMPQQKFTLRQAMHPRYLEPEPHDKDFDLERGLRAIALLLDSFSEGGNKPVDGSIVWGLTEALSLFADRVGRRAGRNK
jgi:hypothetical protein